MATTTEHAQELAHVRRLLIEERYGDANHSIERLLRGEPGPRERLEGLTLRLLGMIRLGRTTDLTTALEEAFEASRAVTDLAARGQLNALAAVVAFRLGSLDRCATHLVRGSRALGAIELTAATTAWAWYDLAIAYSDTGFHGPALAAADQARQVASSVGLRGEEFAAPEIRLKLAVSLDQHGDTDGCQRVLRDVVGDFRHRRRAGELDDVRPGSRGAYGYALARLAAFGEPNGFAFADSNGTEPAASLDEAWELLAHSGDSVRAETLRTFGTVCLAIAERRSVEAVARLEASRPSDGTLGAAEPYRLRALAHLADGDHASAYRADRHAFRLASAQFQRLRELYVEAVAARLDSEELRRSVAGYAERHTSDPLTGLPDRDHLEQHVTAILTRGEPLLLGVCDLDDFAGLNAGHGHSSGDLVLQRIAGILNRVMRRGDFVARAGGDEFALVLPAAARPEIHEIGRRIAAAVAQEDWAALVPGSRVGVTVGWVGVAGDETFGSAADALRAACEAAVQAKRR